MAPTNTQHGQVQSELLPPSGRRQPHRSGHTAWHPLQAAIPQVTQLLPCSTPPRMPWISYLVLLSAIDTASLPTPLGVAVYLALIAGFRGEQVVFILFLGGRKVGTFPKTQARNTVSGGRRAETSISDSCFKKEILPLHSQVLCVAPRNAWRIMAGYRTWFIQNGLYTGHA